MNHRRIPHKLTLDRPGVGFVTIEPNAPIGSKALDLSSICRGLPYALEIFGAEGFAWVYRFFRTDKASTPYAVVVVDDQPQLGYPLVLSDEIGGGTSLIGSEGQLFYAPSIVSSMATGPDELPGNGVDDYMRGIANGTVSPGTALAFQTGSPDARVAVDWFTDFGRRTDTGMFRRAAMEVAAFDVGRPGFYIQSGIPIGLVDDARIEGHGVWFSDGDDDNPFAPKGQTGKEDQHFDNPYRELWATLSDPVFLFLELAIWSLRKASSDYLIKKPGQTFGSPRVWAYAVRESAFAVDSTRGILPATHDNAQTFLVWLVEHGLKNWETLIRWTDQGSGLPEFRDATGKLKTYELHFQTQALGGVAMHHAARTLEMTHPELSAAADAFAHKQLQYWFDECFDATRPTGTSAPFANQLRQGHTKDESAEIWGGGDAVWGLGLATLRGKTDHPAVQSGWQTMKPYMTKGVALRGTVVSLLGPFADPEALLYPEPLQ